MSRSGKPSRGERAITVRVHRRALDVPAYRRAVLQQAKARLRSELPDENTSGPSGSDGGHHGE
jgi:hypothetical protein